MYWIIVNKTNVSFLPFLIINIMAYTPRENIYTVLPDKAFDSITILYILIKKKILIQNPKLNFSTSRLRGVCICNLTIHKSILMVNRYRWRKLAFDNSRVSAILHSSSKSMHLMFHMNQTISFNIRSTHSNLSLATLYFFVFDGHPRDTN
jgi:hypothetical protein